MSIQPVVWAMKLRDVPPLAKLAAIAIGDCYDPSQQQRRTEIGYLAEYCSVDGEQIISALAELAAATEFTYQIQDDFIDVIIPVRESTPERYSSRSSSTLCYIYVIAGATRTKIGISWHTNIRAENLQAWAPETPSITSYTASRSL